VHGTEGSLLYGTPEAKLLVRGGADKEWAVQPALPLDRPSAFHQWVAHIQDGTSAIENIQMALDLTRLMEASNLSARTNQPVRLDTLAS